MVDDGAAAGIAAAAASFSANPDWNADCARAWTAASSCSPSDVRLGGGYMSGAAGAGAAPDCDVAEDAVWTEAGFVPVGEVAAEPPPAAQPTARPATMTTAIRPMSLEFISCSPPPAAQTKLARLRGGFDARAAPRGGRTRVQHGGTSLNPLRGDLLARASTSDFGEAAVARGRLKWALSGPQRRSHRNGSIPMSWR